jgi:hypothetical protein
MAAQTIASNIRFIEWFSGLGRSKFPLKAIDGGNCCTNRAKAQIFYRYVKVETELPKVQFLTRARIPICRKNAALLPGLFI